MPVKIFICYAREDEVLLNQLKTHLMPLQRRNIIEMWYDRNINAGAEWERQIDRNLNTAQIILLLISRSFMASDYCYSVEMSRALDRHKRGQACVIPIILSPVLWHDSPIGELQALPTDGKPIMSSQWYNIDEAFLNVAEGIRKAVEEMSLISSVHQAITFVDVEENSDTDIKSDFFLPPLSPRKNASNSGDSQIHSDASTLSNRTVKLEEKHDLIDFRKPILIIASIDLIMLSISFFLVPASIIAQISVVGAAVIFILVLIQIGLINQWYWFILTFLLSPLTGIVYILFDPASSSIKWQWFVVTLIPSALMGVIYGLFGPTKKPNPLISYNILKQLILVISSVGLILLIFAIIEVSITGNSRFVIYLSLGIIITGYILTLMQLIRLKQGDWLSEILVASIILFPTIPLIGVIYGINGPTTPYQKPAVPTGTIEKKETKKKPQAQRKRI